MSGGDGVLKAAWPDAPMSKEQFLSSLPQGSGKPWCGNLMLMITIPQLPLLPDFLSQRGLGSAVVHLPGTGRGDFRREAESCQVVSTGDGPRSSGRRGQGVPWLTSSARAGLPWLWSKSWIPPNTETPHFSELPPTVNDFVSNFPSFLSG